MRRSVAILLVLVSAALGLPAPAHTSSRVDYAFTVVAPTSVSASRLVARVLIGRADAPCPRSPPAPLPGGGSRCGCPDS